MSNTILFLRHAKTALDSNKPVSQWSLSEEGREQARKLPDSKIFDSVEVIYSSPEQKAIETAKPLAQKLGLEIVTSNKLAELDRDEGGFLTQEKYAEYQHLSMSQLDTSFNNWEAGGNALLRIEEAIADIESQYKNAVILVVGHGITLNLYFAKLLGVGEQAYDRLEKTNFCDWGIVKNGTVTKDIVAD